MRNWFQTRLTRNVWAWVESTLLTLLALLVCFYFSPENPFLFQAPFPWLWLAPVLVALRYGVGLGIYSVLLITFALMSLEAQPMINTTYYRLYLLGGFILTVLCGEFSALWMNRLKTAEQMRQYAKERLDSVSKAYYIIRHSHDQLEQSLIRRPVTLRNAIEDCRELLLEHKGQLDKLSAAKLLNIIVYYCALEKCAIYPVMGETIQPEALAFCGKMQPFNFDDPLVKHAMRDRRTSYFAANVLQHQERSDYLVVAPMITSDDRLLGLLVIEEMPFLVLHQENLEIMSIIVGYYADEAWAIQQSHEILTQYSDCPPAFAAELFRLTRLYHRLHIKSALVGFYLKPDRRREDIVMGLESHHRGLDYTWSTTIGHITVLLTLMPFSRRTGVSGYIRRIERWLKERFGIDLKHDARFDFFHVSLGENPPLETLKTLLDHVKAGDDNQP